MIDGSEVGNTDENRLFRPSNVVSTLVTPEEPQKRYP